MRPTIPLLGRLIFAGLMASLAAMPAQALTLEQAWQMALAQHPNLRSALAERDAASALARQAGAWPNPEVSALVEDTRSETRTTTWQWSQPIEGLGKRAARVEAAQWAQRQAEADVPARQASLRAKLNLAFHAALSAQERVSLAVELGRLASQAREAAELRVAAGKAPPIEEVKARVAEVQAVSSQRSAQGAWHAAWQGLQQAVGGPLAQAEGVQGDPAQLPDAARWQSVSMQPDGAATIRRAELEWSRQRALAEVERTRARPDVMLQLGVKRDAQWGRNQPVVGIALPLPVWDRNEGAITAALRQADRAEADLQSTRIRIQAEAAEALAQLESAVEAARTLRDTVLPAARQALDIASKGYELGKFGMLEVLDAQRTLFDVRHQALASTEQAFRAEARLIELFGQDPTP